MRNIVVLVLSLCSLLLKAQYPTNKCNANTILKQQLVEDPSLLNRLREIDNQTKKLIDRQQLYARTAQITIPVVVHIVYRTAIENISDAQVLSQLAVLNQDFNKKNEDLKNTPSVFTNRIADCGIRFEIANRDINGKSIKGIVRHQTNKLSWQGANDIKLPEKGGVAGWDADSYLNIWVCNLNDYLGLSSYPGVQKGLDGVVIDYRAFGTIGTAKAPYNKGRTCVHEIGHWFNLKHLWGDDDCGDDHVSDTPQQEKEIYGKPVFPQYSACKGKEDVNMTMNFMNYVDDDQMYLFTEGQKIRMRALFEKGGAREKIALSNGWSPFEKSLILDENESLTVYPNPAISEINITSGLFLNSPENIQIIDYQGKTHVETEKVTPSVKIDISHLPTGVFYVRILKDNGFITKRFMKIHE
jgi:hypothetical protein